MSTLLLALVLAHGQIHVEQPPEVHGHMEGERAVLDFQPVELDKIVLLDARPIDLGAPAPGDGCWLDTHTCVFVARKLKAEQEVSTPLGGSKWISIAFGVGALVGLGAGLYLRR